MNIKGVGIGRGVAVGPVIRMAAPLPEPSDAPRAESISAETEIARVEKSLALVNADLNRALPPQACRSAKPRSCSSPKTCPRPTPPRST